jgi:2-amino-4-hydroxy-6-hydroxymethyldihydropteridine diphosphokinase
MLKSKNMARIVLHLGSNEGDRHLFLGDALLAIGRRLGPLVRASDIYETSPWGRTRQPAFLNLACLCETNLSPAAVLRETQAIEQSLGRIRGERWGPRTIDIDILSYDREVIDTPDLQIPHPRLSERRFVLVPLAELMPKWRHPVSGVGVKELLEQCSDTGKVSPWDGQW